MEIGDLLTLILGGGATATIVAVFQGIKSLRQGSRSRERDIVEELKKQRRDAIWERDDNARERDNSDDMRDYYRTRVGDLEYALRSQGKTIPDAPPLPTLRPQVPRPEESSR